MKKLGLVVIYTLLSACSVQYTSNGEQNYLKSHNGVHLVVPPPLSTANISDFYELPAQNQHAQVSIVPPA